MTVRAPDGRLWDVHREIRWPRWRRPDAGGFDLLDGVAWFDGGGDDFIGGLIAALVIGVVVAAVLAIVILFFLPLVLFVVEAVAVLAAAVALGRPWYVVASTDGPPPEVRRWLVRGIRGSRRAVHEVADELARGVHAEPEAAL